MSTQVDFFYFANKYSSIFEDEVGEGLDILGFGHFF